LLWKGLATPNESRVGKALMGLAGLIWVASGGIQMLVLDENNHCSMLYWASHRR
jgi:hypothetical protein